MQPVSGHSADDFTQTRWSMVQRLHAPRPDDARQALADLALRYWYPVYAYVRRCGHAPEIAQDIVRVFFQRVAVDAFETGPLRGGRFRDWLLSRLNAFLAGDWRELAGDDTPVATPPLDDLEQRNRDDLGSGDSPEDAFHHGFALEVLARGFKALQVEARETGHLDMYEMLEPYLARDPLPGQYEEMGRRLGIRPLVLVLALKRLRQRFRELAHAELADAVASPEDMADEQRTLFAALARHG